MSKGNTLGDGQTLNAGQYLESGNGYYAVMQQDGNFVLYQTLHWIPKNALWASNTCMKGVQPRRVIMQNDGSLVVYDVYNTPTWASNTFQKGAKPHRLVMQPDRNLVIYDGSGKATWASNTNI